MIFTGSASIILDRLTKDVNEGSNLHKLLAKWLGVYSHEINLSQNQEQIWTYTEVAELGLKAALQERTERSFLSGLENIMKRQYFLPFSIPSLEVDPLAILAISLGVHTLNLNKSTHDWVSNFIDRALIDEAEAIRKNILIDLFHKSKIRHHLSFYRGH